MQGNSFRYFSFVGIAKSCIVEFGFCFDIEMWVYLRIPRAQTKKKNLSENKKTINKKQTAYIWNHLKEEFIWNH